MQWEHGVHAGPSRTKVAGLPSCGDVNNAASNCVVLLPIIDHQSGHTCPDASQPGSDPVCVVQWGAFWLVAPSSDSNPGAPPSGCDDSDCHLGRLLGPAIVTNGVGTAYTPGSTGVLLVKLSS